MSSSVECYLLAPTNDVPNSQLPVILYRDVLPEPRNEETTTQFLTAYGWEKRVWEIYIIEWLYCFDQWLIETCDAKGTWGHISMRHFHPNTHECYGGRTYHQWYIILRTDFIWKGIFHGNSTLLLGKIKDGEGIEVDVRTGDVIVLPAGTAHSSLESCDGYRYIGVYPKVSSHSDSAYFSLYLSVCTLIFVTGMPQMDKRKRQAACNFFCFDDPRGSHAKGWSSIRKARAAGVVVEHQAGSKIVAAGMSTRGRL